MTKLSIVHRPSSIVHRPSSIVHRPSSIVHRPSSIVHRPSSIANFIKFSLFLTALSLPSYAVDLIEGDNAFLSSNAALVKEKISSAIEQIKKQESEVVYNNKQDKATFAGYLENENVSTTYSSSIGPVVLYFFATQGPNAPQNVKLVNNATISSYTEVFTNRWGKATTDLIYIENNGNIIGKGVGSNEPAIYLRSRGNFYIKNNGRIETLNSGYLYAQNIITLENLGYLEKHGIGGDKVIFTNAENGNINNANIYAYNSMHGENLGTFEKSRIGWSNDGLFFNKNNITDSTLNLTSGIFINDGDITNARSIYLNKNHTFFNNNKISESVFSISNNSALVNRGALLNTTISSNNSTVDLRNSTISKKFDMNGESQSKVVIDELTKIENTLDANGTDETLIMKNHSDDQSHSFEGNKYIGFENLEMHGKWKLDQADANFSKSIIFSDAIADLNGRTLNSPSVINGENSRLNISGSNSKVAGSLTNQGVIAFPDSSKNTVFTINKDYIGENGKLMMNVDAQLDQPEFDLLVVEGFASGTTLIDFIEPSKLAYNLAQPVRLVKTASSDDNAFVLAQADYGKYSYYLNRIEGSDESGKQYVSWYLNQKQMTAPTEPEKPDNPTEPETPTEPNNPTTPETPTEPNNPTTPETPTEPDNPTMPETPTEPNNPTTPETPTEPDNPTAPETPTEPNNPITPETPTEPNNPSTPATSTDQKNPTTSVVPNKPVQPSQFNNEMVGVLSGLVAHQNLFTQTFHDRAAKDRLEESSAAWVRVYQNNTKNRLNGADARMESHSTALQLGYDFAKFKNSDRTFTLGSYAVLGRSKTNTDLLNEHESVRSISKGYALGIYATLEKANWYMDSWVSLSHLNTKVTTGSEKTNYRSNALQASLESGYNQLISTTGNYEYYVQPQAQLIYHHLFKPNLSHELKMANNKYFTTRLGVRIYQKFLNVPDIGSPYVSFNWWNNTNQVGIISGTNLVSVKGAKNIKNVEVGLDKWNVTNNLSLWTNVSYFHGTHGYRDIRYNIGASYKF